MGQLNLKSFVEWRKPKTKQKDNLQYRRKYLLVWCDQQGTNFQNIKIAHISQYEKNEQCNKEIGRRSKQTFLQRRCTDGQ